MYNPQAGLVPPTYYPVSSPQHVAVPVATAAPAPRAGYSNGRRGRYVPEYKYRRALQQLKRARRRARGSSVQVFNQRIALSTVCGILGLAVLYYGSQHYKNTGSLI
jgi:hypothetical protein